MEKSWSEALSLMRRALAILDAADAPPEIGADLDLAIARLQCRLGEPSDIEDVGISLAQILQDQRELIH